MNSTTARDAAPWYYRAPTVILALVFFTPVGLFLVWRGVPSWTRNAKIGAAALASIWFLFGFVIPATDEHAPIHHNRATRVTPSPSEVAHADAQGEAQRLATGDAQPGAPHAGSQTTARTSAAQRDDDAATGDPSLLVPVAPTGFTLIEVGRMDGPDANAKAKYRGPGGLTAEVWPYQNDDKLEKANPAQNVYPATVGKHPAILEVQAPIQTIALSWRAARWYFTVSVRASSASNLDAARAAASKIARETSTWADRIVIGDGYPSDQERAAHLAAINAALAKASEASNKAAEGNRGKELDRYRAALKKSGVEVVASVALNRIDHDVLEITLRPSWVYESKAARLEAATAFWNAWAAIHSPNNPDDSFIRLLDSAGNKVGGSSSLAGSSVSVRE